MMKKKEPFINKTLQLISVTLLFLLVGTSATAWSQLRYNSSDWNVPPPLPPGTLPKTSSSYTGKKTGVLLLSSDISVPVITNFPAAGLEGLPVILRTAPIVFAPSLPTFIQSASSLINIPLPGIPVSPDPPYTVFSDDIGVLSLDIPTPPTPDMPALPDTTGKFSNMLIIIPITPSIITQQEAVLSPGNDPPVSELPVPPIPLDVGNTIAVNRKPAQTNGEPAGKSN